MNLSSFLSALEALDDFLDEASPTAQDAFAKAGATSAEIHEAAQLAATVAGALALFVSAVLANEETAAPVGAQPDGASDGE